MICQGGSSWPSCHGDSSRRLGYPYCGCLQLLCSVQNLDKMLFLRVILVPLQQTCASSKVAKRCCIAWIISDEAGRYSSDMMTLADFYPMLPSPIEVWRQICLCPHGVNAINSHSHPPHSSFRVLRNDE